MTIEPPDDTPRSDFDALVEDTPQIQWEVAGFDPLGFSSGTDHFLVRRRGDSSGIKVTSIHEPNPAKREAMAHCIADALTQAGF